MVAEAVIPAAGYGTRVSPASRAIPKELFPVPVLVEGGGIYLVPALQLIIHRLYDIGVRRFYIVANNYKIDFYRGFLKPDVDYLNTLLDSGKKFEAKLLDELYKILDNIEINYILQDPPRGVGDAIFRCMKYISEPFMIHMGDDFLVGPINEYRKLVKYFDEYGADAAILVKKVDDPRQYGVVEGDEENDIIYVRKIIEKPAVAKPMYSILGIYTIKPIIFKFMDMLYKRGEWELTDAVQEMVNQGYKVIGVKTSLDSIRIDIGRVDSYIEVFNNPIRLEYVWNI